MKLLIKLPHEWVVRSRRWAVQSVGGYENGHKESSRAYARPGIDKSVPHQFCGKAAECAYCLSAGIDPRELDWSPKPDIGWDVMHLGLRIDVKGTRTDCLIWPVTKNGFLNRCKADVFVLARQIEFDLFEISGWITVRQFIERHHTADSHHRFLDAGTKYLHFRELADIENLSGDEALVREQRRWDIT